MTDAVPTSTLSNTVLLKLVTDDPSWIPTLRQRGVHIASRECWCRSVVSVEDYRDVAARDKREKCA